MWWSGFRFRFHFHRKSICSASRIRLSMSDLLLRYSMQNNQITLIRLIIPMIIALSVFSLKLMKYPSCPPSTLPYLPRPNQHRMKHCVESFGSISILAATEKNPHSEEEKKGEFWKGRRYPVVCVKASWRVCWFTGRNLSCSLEWIQRSVSTDSRPFDWGKLACW